MLPEKNTLECSFPGVATIFIYVISNAYLALFPFFGTIGIHHEHEFLAIFRAANTDVNVPLSIALMSFIFVETWGMRAVGASHYISGFINVRQLVHGLKEIFTGKIKTGPMNIVFGFINFFVGVLEIFSHLTRMLSFTFRLFGNMTAGEILILVSCFLIPLVFSIPFYGLELLIGLIQALIFSGLTLVFGTIAMSSPHEEDQTNNQNKKERRENDTRSNENGNGRIDWRNWIFWSGTGVGADRILGHAVPGTKS